MPQLFDDDGDSEEGPDNVASEESTAHDQQRLERERALERDGVLVDLIRNAGWMSEAYRGFAIALDETIIGSLIRRRELGALPSPTGAPFGLEREVPPVDDDVVQRLIVDASALTVCHFAPVHVMGGVWTPRGGLLLVESALEVSLLLYSERHLGALAFGGAAPPLVLDPLDDRLDAPLYLILRPESGWTPPSE